MGYKLSESEQNELKTLCYKYYERLEMCREIMEDGFRLQGVYFGSARDTAHYDILDYIGMDREDWRPQVLEFEIENIGKGDLLDIYKDCESFYVVVLNRAEWLRWSKECPDESWSSEYGWRKGYLDNPCVMEKLCRRVRTQKK